MPLFAANDLPFITLHLLFHFKILQIIFQYMLHKIRLMKAV